MNVSQLSIQKPVFAWMLMLGLLFFGGFAYRYLGVGEMPDVDFPVINISLTYEGASPQVMETQVVDVIEEALMSLEGLKNISSTSKQEEASLVLEMDLKRDVDAALLEVQTRLSQVQRKLPVDMDPPVISKTNPEDQPIIWVAFSADKPPREVMRYARDHIKDRLQTIPGVSEIMLSGFVAPVMRVWVDPQKLAQYDLTVQDVINTLKSQHIEIPSGRLETKEHEINIRTLGEASTPEEIARLPLLTRGGQTVYKSLTLGDVAHVERGLDDVRRISRSGGEPAVGFGIKKQRGSNALKVASALYERVNEIGKDLPSGMALWVNFDTTRFIKQAATHMQKDLLLSVLLTSIVCLLFLKSWSAGFNVLLAIPSSIVGSLLALYVFGFTLNTFTLLALTLSIGIVVDDAIMVLENIIRHHEMGKGAVQAALDGTKEITPAAMATTLSIAAIFVPVIFVSGMLGLFLFQFGVTLSVAVFLSLLEALVITPMRTAGLLGKKNKAPHQDSRWFSWFVKAYERSLNSVLRHPLITTLIMVLFFGVSFPLFKQLKKEFVPAQDQSAFLIRVETTLGASITAMDEKMKQVEQTLMGLPEVMRYFSAVGGFGGGDVNTGILFVSLKDRAERPVNPKLGHVASQADMMNLIREELKSIPELRVAMQDFSTRGLTSRRGFPVEFSIQGPEWDPLVELAQKMGEALKQNPAFIDVDTDYREGQPEIQITPDRQACFDQAVSVDDVATTIRALMGGQEVGKVTEAGRRNDIRLRLPENFRLKAEDIGQLHVRNKEGQLVSLAKLIVIQEAPTLKSITRKNRERSITLFANVPQGFSQEQSLNEVTRLSKPLLGEGYRLVWSGTAETFKESFDSLQLVLLLGVVVAYMILASQYNSFVHPLIVLMALPLSVTGAWLALWLTGLSLNLYSFIGFVLLMGLVKKNSILLVDFTNQKRAQGLGVTQALIEACPQRLRPILMTSLATVAAAIPTALSQGPGFEARSPMAWVIIGGVFLSTFLTLYGVPAVYRLVHK